MARRTRPAPGSLPPLDPWTRAASGSPSESPRTVVVFVYDGVSSTEVELVADALAAPLGASVRFASAAGGDVVGVEPVRSIVSEPMVDVASATAVVLPGGLAWKREAENAAVLDWIRRVADSTQGVVAVSTGSLLLAATGLLDGCEATGHWLAHDLMADLGAEPSYARVVHDERLVTASGARAGVQAARDLANEMLYAR